MSFKNESIHPWINFYADGVPAEINPDAFSSIANLFEESVRNNSNKPAYNNMGKVMSFSDLDQLSLQFASYLQSIGLKKGDRIALQIPNVLQFPVALFGALRAGLVVVNTNPLYTSREMKHQFVDSGAKAIVIMANFAHNLEKIIDETPIEHVIVTELGDLLGFPKKYIVNLVVKHIKKLVPAFTLPQSVSFGEALSIGANKSFTKVNLTGQDLAFIQYTGGTTGVAKGARLSHRNMIANVQAIDEWFYSKMRHANVKGTVNVIAALPLYHVFALTVNALASLKWGANNVLITNPRDMAGFIAELKKQPFHIFPGLNTLFNGLMNHPDFGKIDFSNLQISIAGGMALQKVVADKWKKMTGCDLIEGYGLSETSPVLSVSPLTGGHKLGTIGIPIPSTELRVRTDDERWAEIDEKGEICAAGPQVMSGYYNRPDETEKVLFEDDGKIWFRTGDIGMMDKDGFFRIVDRKKDMILVSGFNVYPNEVEQVVSQCPGVLEVACIGVPDEKATEVVKIFVVKKDESLTEADIKLYCRENLTPYKNPRYIEFRTELPKSNVGKILRRELRDEVK